METKKKTYSPMEFERAMAGFFGTSNYYEHKVTEDIKFLLTDGCNWIREAAEARWIFDDIKFLLTDGCNWIREAADARWLFDDILFNQLRPEIKGLPFQVWVLWKDEDNEDRLWVLRCEDGNDNTVLVQMLMEAIDFPIDEIRIWVVGGVAMLPSEY